jgi:hypothetical protein
MDPVTLGMAKADAKKNYASKASLVVPSSVYRTLLACKQTKGAAMDRSGRGGDAIPPAATYGPMPMWANAGYLTTGTGTGLGVSIAANKTSFDLATQSVILAFVVIGAPPAGIPAIMGNADAATRRGVYLGARSDGKLRVLVNTSDGLMSALAIPNKVVFDGTDHHGRREHSIDLRVHRRAVLCRLPQLLHRQHRRHCRHLDIGASGGVISVAGTTAIKLHSFHMIFLTGGVPANLGQVARRLYEAPGAAVPESTLLPTKR